MRVEIDKGSMTLGILVTLALVGVNCASLEARAGGTDLVVVAPAQGKTLRWSSQGDLLTMDPHSTNENLTNTLNGQVYETLVDPDKQMSLVPRLALSWQLINNTTWLFKLRPGVRFHDGTPFTADDVVFSVERAQQLTSAIRVYANALGKPTKIDNLTVQFTQDQPNPILLTYLANVQVMSKTWCEQHNATRPLDWKNKEETFAARHVNGTGPYMLKLREEDVKTVYVENPDWWGRREGNVTEIVYRPIKNAATRVAALMSGEVDFVLDPPVQDIPRLKSNPQLKVVEGQENRIIFIGMDQFRDELINSDVKGRNPFKDRRVRQALYQAIDIETIKTKIMRGLATPTGGMTPSPLGSNPEHEKRLPFDRDKAKKQLAEAGYPNGFEVGMDCPNDRYINDEQICQALVAMWAQIGVKANLTTLPKAIYFAKLLKHDTSLYLLGWGGSTTDAQDVLTPVLHGKTTSGQGRLNYGRYVDARLDQLIDQAAVEMNPEKRASLLAEALKAHNDETHHIPLHRQLIPWAMRSNVRAVHRPDNSLEVQWVQVE